MDPNNKVLSNIHVLSQWCHEIFVKISNIYVFLTKCTISLCSRNCGNETLDTKRGQENVFF